jgi:hypothetical protein
MRVLLAAIMLAACAGTARAQSDSNEGETRALIATGAGAALAITGLAVGGTVLAMHEGEADRKVGAYTLLTGFALAPIVSHAIAGEWDRAALFGAVPVAAAIGATLMIESGPVLLGRGQLGQRRVLALCYGIELLSSAIGLFDSLNAGQRARDRTRSLAVAPWIERDRLGIAFGGSL